MKIKSLFALLSIVSLVSFNSAQAWGEHCYLTGDPYGGYEWVCTTPDDPIPTPDPTPLPNPTPGGPPEMY